MHVTTYTDARANLKSLIDRAIDDHEEIAVTRRNGEAVVMVSLDDWNAILETLHMSSTPTNASRLRASIDQLNLGQNSV